MLLRFYMVTFLILSVLFIFARLRHNKELLGRTITLFVLIHIICLALYGGKFAFGGFVVCLVSISVFELAPRYHISPWFMAVASAPIVLFCMSHVDRLGYIMPFFFLVSALTFVLNEKRVSSRAYFFLFYSFVLIPCALALVGIHASHPEGIMMLFLLLKLSDGFAYLLGKKFGHRRIFPTLSPNKTMEGYLFGLLGSIATVALLHTAFPILRGNSLYQDLLLINYIFLFGNAGDLFFSAIKRKLGVKDFSALLQGHGGLLDCSDNVFFAAPIFFLCIQHQIL